MASVMQKTTSWSLIALTRPSFTAANNLAPVIFKAPGLRLYRPVETLRKWVDRNFKDLFTNDKQKELNNILKDIEAGPDAGKPMAISSLSEPRIREIFSLGKDEAIDISAYKVILPEGIKRSLNKVNKVTGVGRPQIEPFARTPEQGMSNHFHILAVDPISKYGDWGGPTPGRALRPDPRERNAHRGNCEQSGYNGNDEGEAEHPKNRDIGFSTRKHAYYS
ncbi:uncharacterized protein CDV56_103204 [Aspergillus thermomutatus]|uniref:Uncharacterized protein n=1 Tax=Aspergillus thermomutatus TaxID=41047 RepID=A0A397GEG0_ASPTH|nr:uncharacterized protein CDV56_103204 [Aspergillus thermomutatus]RHZ47796.1 hypothetical protein CDV56_103204 [Aspergillus thermomutatus]